MIIRARRLSTIICRTCITVHVEGRLFVRAQMSARELDANWWLTRTLRHGGRVATVQERYISLRNDSLWEVMMSETMVQSSS